MSIGLFYSAQPLRCMHAARATGVSGYRYVCHTFEVCVIFFRNELFAVKPCLFSATEEKKQPRIALCQKLFRPAATGEPCTLEVSKNMSTKPDPELKPSAQATPKLSDRNRQKTAVGKRCLGKKQTEPRTWISSNLNLSNISLALRSR